MTITACVGTPRAGQGSSHFALAMARDAASEGARTLLVDCDAAGGTIADILGLDLGPGSSQLGMAKLWARGSVTAGDLEATAVAIPGQKNLWVIPNAGLMSSGVWRWLPRLMRSRTDDLGFSQDERPVIADMPGFDLCIFDLGECLAYPDMDQAPNLAKELGKIFQRIFMVVRYSPSLFSYNISVLQNANLPRGELILAAPQGLFGSAAQVREEAKRALADNVEGVVLGAEWYWDETAARRAEEDRKPMAAPGLAKKLGLLVKTPVPAPAEPTRG
ncbi:MAG: hypothetical protein ACYDGR_17935 [Candidatus Dormibacteria bacterium]